MNESPLPGPLEEFLNHPPNLPLDAARRALILQQTSSELPKRRPSRWPIALAVAAAIAFVFVYFFKPAPEIKNDFVEKKSVTPDEKPNPRKEVLVEAPTHPRDLEWRAFDAADDPVRVKLYFQAGDLYLDRLDDVQSALRCYQQAIYFCEASDLEINPNDNWLVMALKRDHRKEK